MENERTRDYKNRNKKSRIAVTDEQQRDLQADIKVIIYY
jgi:hypothetical protein